MTDDKLNQFGGDEVEEQKNQQNLAPVDEASNEGPTQSELEHEFHKRKQQMKKVCIVEEDIKLTNEEKEQLREMKKERDREEAERSGAIFDDSMINTQQSPPKKKKVKKAK